MLISKDLTERKGGESSIGSWTVPEKPIGNYKNNFKKGGRPLDEEGKE
jgi:hypothetical protein